MYRALVLSKLEYGSVVYASARPSLLKKLNTVHLTGLRLCTGALRTSPSTSVCCDAGVPPLSYIRDRAILRYGATVRVQLCHPNWKVMFRRESQRIFENRPTVTAPTGVRLKRYMRENRLRMNNVLPIGVCEVPPWTIPTLQVHLELSNLRKAETANEEYRQRFEEILHGLPHHKVIYTDGSKTEFGVGSSFAVEGEQHSWSLSREAGVLTAELYAIWQGLLFCDLCLTHRRFVVVSDSLIALRLLQSVYADDALVLRIFAVAAHILSSGKEIVFLWVPGHVPGINGNHIADEAAGNATRNPQIDVSLIRDEDLVQILRLQVRGKWQNEWSNHVSKLGEVKGSVLPLKAPFPLTRREEVVLTRLRIGHTLLTSLHLLLGQPTPVCDECDVPLTVQHVLAECDLYHQHRVRHHLPQQIRNILRNDSTSISSLLQFLKETHLMARL